MRRHFLRLYLKWALVGAVLVLVASAAVMHSTRGGIDAHFEAAVERPVAQLREQLGDRPLHRRELRAMERTLHDELGMPGRIVPIDAAPPPVRQAVDGLAAGEAATLRERGRRLTVARIDGHHALVVGPFFEPPRRRWLVAQTATVAALIALLGVALWVSMRPLERRLVGLGDVADRLGAGHLDARAELRGDGLDALAERLNTMAARISAQVDARRELLRAVSHELRTPLARLFLLLDRAADDTTEDARRDTLLRMDRAAGEMNTLVEELLVFSRLDDVAAVRAPVALRAALEDAAARPEFARDGLRIDVHADDETPNLDVRLFDRIAANLLSNAARYARTAIALRGSTEADVVTLTVDDDGPGVRPTDRARIFEPFVTADAARTNGVSGLGLAIVARAAEAHGGRAWCEASPLGGARFVVTLSTQRGGAPSR